ncbi:MAG: uroporphyrinogen-III synthase [Pyrinomonadaceae bacterium]|nr:uroporphyrinogen-III synthase [Pyrinomonadaceae bacterium]
MLNSINNKTFALFDNPINKKLAAAVENSGAKLLKFPPIEAEKVVLNENSTELLKNLDRFDWIIFPDVLTVEFFLECLEENQIDAFELDAIRVCALGESVSDRLRFGQLHADLLPRRIDAENVLSSLKNYAAGDEFADLSFLLIVENSFGSAIKDELIKAGAIVSELPIYRIKLTKKAEIGKLKALLKGGAIDEFIFSAPTDFISLKYIFKAEPLARIFSEIKVSAVDGATLQIVREHHIKRADLFRLEKLDKV